MSCLTFDHGNITFNDEVKVGNMLEYQLLSIGVIGVRGKLNHPLRAEPMLELIFH